MLLRSGPGAIQSGELTLWPASYVFVDAYDAGRFVMRSSSSGSGISIVGGDATHTSRIYAGGVALANRALELHPGTYAEFFGGIARKYTTASVSTLLDNSNHIVLADSSTVDVTISLPVTPIDGQEYTIKAIDNTNKITVSGNGKLIDGNVDMTLGKQASLKIVYDNTEWWIV